MQVILTKISVSCLSSGYRADQEGAWSGRADKRDTAWSNDELSKL